MNHSMAIFLCFWAAAPEGTGGDASPVQRDAQRQYVVIGTLAPIIVEFMCSFVVIGAAAPKGAMSC